MIRIAIDGTASSGKGTLAKKVAQSLGYQYIDTGALYRSVALIAWRRNVDWRSEAAVSQVAKSLTFQFVWNHKKLEVVVDGENVSEAIRTDEIGKGASVVSALPKVREALLDIQKNMAQSSNVVMDGRDIGTVIIPDAEVKIYVDADIDERARRRHKDFVAKGKDITLGQVKKELLLRDQRDKNRPIAPLKQAKDAHFLDTTHLSIEQGVQRILERCTELLDK